MRSPLVCRRWADCNGLGSLTSWFHPLHLFSKEVRVLVLLWDIINLCEGNRWPETHPNKRRLKPVFGLVFFQLILVSFSNCPRRCCSSLAHAAQARMARFYFHDISFFAGKHSAQFTKPTLCKCTHKHRSASEYASMFVMGKLHDQTNPFSQM